MSTLESTCKNITLVLAIAFMVLIAGCQVKQTAKSSLSLSSPSRSSGINVVATFFPLVDMTSTILGDKGSVYSLVPAGVEPHDYEPTPADIKRLNSADAFVSMGVSVKFAAFEEKLVDSLDSRVRLIHAGEGIPLIETTKNDMSIAGGSDPHIWLSPTRAKLMAKNILEGIVALDEKDADYYTANTERLLADLDTLDSEFHDVLAHCEKRSILVTHNSFSYLADDYGFKTIYISGLEPEAEPTPGQIKKLVDEAKKEDIKYVFYEEIVDPRVAETIANEVGAQMLVLSPLEGTLDPHATYFSLMRQNLDNLRVALRCQ